MSVATTRSLTNQHAMRALRAMSRGPMRFNGIGRAVGFENLQALTMIMKKMVRDGTVARTVLDLGEVDILDETRRRTRREGNAVARLARRERATHRALACEVITPKLKPPAQRRDRRLTKPISAPSSAAPDRRLRTPVIFRMFTAGRDCKLAGTFLCRKGDGGFPNMRSRSRNLR